MSLRVEVLNQWAVAKYTAVISDLHLCEAEPVNRRFPLWKKYKTRQFFFDQEFADWLKKISEMANGEPIELVLNGDIFDFDSVTSRPQHPAFSVSWLERRRGLSPQSEKSEYKIKRILQDHELWLQALRQFVQGGNRVVFVIGNHDLELHFAKVQSYIAGQICDTDRQAAKVRFVEWFYISNKDTLIEHGNQYDPYCMAESPICPFVLRYNKLEVKVPFGNLATRYLINGMGFFNPHADSNYLMSAREYVVFFLRHIIWSQPLLMISWLWGSVLTMWQTFFDRLKAPVKDALTIEDRVEDIAQRSNATPRMVRELQELFVEPAASRPLSVIRELWLDRAFLVMLAFTLVFELFLLIRIVFEVSIFWLFLPLFLFLPFFIFYSRNVSSEVVELKEPREKVLSRTGLITGLGRVVYGHTHVARHEVIGSIEHLNSGTWSPAFEDIECTKPVGHKTFVWIFPGRLGGREAKLFQLSNGEIQDWQPRTPRRRATKHS